MKKTFGKKFFLYAAISLLAIVFVVGYFNQGDSLIKLSTASDGDGGEGNDECLEWETTCTITATGTSDTFDTPTGEADAKADSLAKCQAAQNDIGNSMNDCVNGYSSVCVAPCHLSSQEVENTVAQSACTVSYCTQVTAPPGPGDDDLKTFCTYNYDPDGTRHLVSCMPIHPRNRAGFPVGWSCFSSDGTLKYKVMCTRGTGADL